MRDHTEESPGLMNEPLPTTPDQSRSRRATPRIEVLGQLHGQVVAWRLSLQVRELGAGGFSVECDWTFPIGSVHVFRFTTERGDVVVLTARSVHTRAITSPAGTERFISGFEFLLDRDHADQGVAILLDAVTSTLAFE
jgi:hypothetical protein